MPSSCRTWPSDHAPSVLVQPFAILIARTLTHGAGSMGLRYTLPLTDAYANVILGHDTMVSHSVAVVRQNAGWVKFL